MAVKDEDDETKIKDDTTVVLDDTTGEKDSDKPKAEFTTVEEALAEIDKLKNINKEVIESRNDVKTKLRSLEEQAEQQKQEVLEEQGKFKELYEAEKEKRVELESTNQKAAVDTALYDALEEAGVLSTKTALSLIDRELLVVEEGKVKPESIVDAIAKLQTEHDILFNPGGKPVPKPKRPDEETPNGGFEAEMRKAMTEGANVAKLGAIRKKYGKL